MEIRNQSIGKSKSDMRMHKSILFFVLWISYLFCQAQNQDNYRVGFAKMNIDPPDSIFGLSLAGYGLPAEGRFSITWELIDSSKSPFSFKGYEAVATVDRQVYTLDKKGRLWLQRGKKRIKSLDSPNLKMIMTDGVYLYAVDGMGTIYRADHRDDALDWNTIGKEDVEAFAVYNGNIIYTDQQNRLWKMRSNPDGSFRKEQIGRHNDVTYPVQIKQLAVAADRLYALDANGTTYVGKHKTEESMEVGAVAIQHDGEKVIIVTADVCGVDYSFTQKMKKAIASKHNITTDAILINASHTHFAPVTQAWKTWAHFYQQPDTAYLNDVLGKNILAVADKAIANIEPASIYFGRGETYIGTNRRDNVRKSEGPVDRTLDVVKVLDAKQKLMGVVFFAGCHPVFPNSGEESFTLSANFPGVARKVLAEQIDCGHSLFVQGCGGDINPVSTDYRQTGADLGNGVLQVLEADMRQVSGTLTAFVDSVLIPVKPMTPEAIAVFREKVAAERSTVYTDKDLRWADLMEKRYQTNSVRQEMPVYVQTLNIGSWKLVGLSREAVTSYGMKIRQLWPERQVSVAGYCNDVASYLPDSWHIENAVYEGYDSFFWYGQDGIPPLNVQELILDEIKFKNR